MPCSLLGHIPLDTVLFAGPAAASPVATPTKNITELSLCKRESRINSTERRSEKGEGGRS
ncbi:hypothetical protein M404DRAFT_994236 [Pisolithus tinctorius Marx 270]|uniref:Uncharacterized protein n=1 Tax=Pisolithus tinctorius Marx 270 TaxID=870435 RepID=A0A0C3PR30_PISTI|nr:hypothetical protein M404DRAFT_994236 [Pisolithus tinctorius Marx 270]